MALSDWDTLAFNTEGEPWGGSMRGFVEGTSVEIYKNWLYVRDEKMWVEGRDYVKPTIAKVNSGELQLSDFEITAVRGPQEAIFCFVQSSRYHSSEPSEHRYMCGLGCSGYVTPWDLVMKEEGLPTDKWKPLYTSTMHADGLCTVGFMFEAIDTEGIQEAGVDGAVTREVLRPYIDIYLPQWVGVQQTTLQAFVEWFNTIDGFDEGFKKWKLKVLERIASGRALRCNQGDVFFAANGILGGQVTTPVGESEGPLLEQMIKGFGEEMRDE